MEIKVFISYAHEDEIWLKEADPLGRENPKCLPKRWQRTLEVQGWGGDRKASFWYDRERDPSLLGGKLWQTRIVQALDGAQVAVLLVTEKLVASPFFRDTELPRLVERSKAGELEVVPILVEPANYTALGIETAQFTPGKPTPLTDLLAASEKAGNDAHLEITQALVWALERALEKAKAPRPASPVAAPPPRSAPPPPSVAPSQAPVRRSIFRRWPLWAGVGGVVLGAGMVALLSRLPEWPAERPSAESKPPAAKSPAPEPIPPTPIPERTPGPDAATVPPGTKQLFAVESASKLVGPGEAFAVAFGADGDSVAGLFAGSVTEVRTWSLSTRRQQSQCALPYSANGVGAFSPDGKRALVGNPTARGGSKGGAALIEVVSCKVVGNFAAADEVRSVAFSPGGGDLYLVGRRFVEVWTLDEPAPKARHEFSVLRGYGRMTAVAPGGRKVILLGGDLPSGSPKSAPPSIAAWNNTLSREIWHLDEGTDFQTTSVAVSPNGKLVLAGQGGRALLLDSSNGRTEAPLPCPAGALNAVAFSPGGDLAAAGGDDFALCLWNVDKRQLLGVSKTSRMDVSNIAFSHDGRQLVVAASHLFVFQVPH